MKLVFTHENLLIVSNIQNILTQNSINVVIKNQYTAGGAGDIAPQETWPELWVEDGSDYNKAISLIDTIEKQNLENKSWVCAYCHEENQSSFEICWHCQREHIS